MINDLWMKIISLKLRKWSTIFSNSFQIDTPFGFFVLTSFVAESQHFPREYHPPENSLFSGLKGLFRFFSGKFSVFPVSVTRGFSESGVIEGK